MNKEEISIQMTQVGKEITVTAIMPVWFSKNPCGDLKVSIPLIGLETNCDNECDVELAVKEAVHAFSKMANLHGRGFVKELELLGWAVEKKTQKKSVMNIPKVNFPILNNLFETGHLQAFQIAV